MTKVLKPLEYLDHLSGVVSSEFAFKKYLDKDQILLEILLNGDEKLTARITERYYEDLINRRFAIMRDLGLSTSDMVEGKMTVKEILHDAKPLRPELSSFFVQNKDSKYSIKPGLYPLGMAAGKIEIL